MLSDYSRINDLFVLSNELNQVQSLDILMERVLSEARTFVKADAGSIYLVENDLLNFTYTQNDTFSSRLKKGDKLIYSTFTIPINTDSIAGYVAESGKILRIDDAYDIPTGKFPFKFNSSLDQLSGYKTHSILTVPLKLNSGKIIGVLQVINALDNEGDSICFKKSDEGFMIHFANMAAVALERAQMTIALLLRMIKMAELRDPKETGVHVKRVAGASVEIYERWAIHNGLNRDEIDRQRDILYQAAMLHDVGKIGISDLILKKPAKLSQDEFTAMKQHTVMGCKLFGDCNSPFEIAAAEVALNHHQRWDGLGYPNKVDLEHGVSDVNVRIGYSGNDIPLFGRIVALVDVFDALSSRRCYKEPWSEKDILEELKRGAGSQFDPELVNIFMDAIEVIRNIQNRYS